MRRFWRARRRDATRWDKLEERLAESAEAGDWPLVLKLARRSLKREPEDSGPACYAAQARLTLAGEKDAAKAGRDAAEWLDASLQRHPRDATVLYLRGWAAQVQDKPSEAIAFWRRAWQADPDDPAIAEALVKSFVLAGSLPEWGVPVVESTLLNQ